MYSKYYIGIMVQLVVCIIQVQAQATTTKDLLNSGYQLIWFDEFSGLKLDNKKWKLLVNGKRGDAIHTLNAVQLDGKGNLIIEASAQGNNVQTAIIHTEGLFETTYGYFECIAKITRLSGVWPAFWLQSSQNQDNGVPESNGVEIDIFEYFHHLYKDKVLHTIHWGGYGATHQIAGPVFSTLKNTADDYHVFGLEWTPEYYATYVDGIKTNMSNTAISKVPESVLLSLEIDKNVAGPLKISELPVQFKVDYVRVYKKK